MNATCAACGSMVPEAASICGRCAHPIERSPAASAGPQAQQKPQPEWIKKLGPLGAIIATVLKFKTAILLALGKAAQLKTLLTMLASFGLYWTLYGWKFAAGLVIGIYIHEMGHVWMLRHYGLRASSPMFIPGFGAFVSLYDSPANAEQDARIGLAGPMWGAGAAIAALLLSRAHPDPAWFAIVRVTALMNLFNLTPVWMLDGGRGFRALDLRQRLYLMGLAALLWYSTGETMFALFLIGAAYRVLWKKDSAPEPDSRTFALFAGLLAILAALLALAPAPGAVAY